MRRGGPAATARLPAGLSEPAPSPLPGERRGAAARPPPPSVTSGLGDDPSRCGPPAAPRALAAASSARLPAAQQVEGGCGRARISGGEAASAIGTTSGIRQRGPAPGRGRGESGRGDGAHSAACRARRAAGAGSARGQRVSRPYRTRAVAGRSLRHTDRGGGTALRRAPRQLRNEPTPAGLRAPAPRWQPPGASLSPARLLSSH